MSDRFEYPDLGVVVQRGPMGQPSVVTGGRAGQDSVGLRATMGRLGVYGPRRRYHGHRRHPGKA